MYTNTKKCKNKCKKTELKQCIYIYILTTKQILIYIYMYTNLSFFTIYIYINVNILRIHMYIQLNHGKFTIILQMIKNGFISFTIYIHICLNIVNIYIYMKSWNTYRYYMQYVKTHMISLLCKIYDVRMKQNITSNIHYICMLLSYIYNLYIVIYSANI